MNAAAAYVLTVLAGLQDRFEGRKDRGATAVEYGLMVGLIAAVIIAAVTLLGGNINTLFNNIAGRLPSGAAA